MTRPRNHRRFRLYPTGALIAATAAVALTLAACGGPTPAAGDVQAGSAEGDAVTVVTHDNEFAPATLEAEAGSEVTVEVTNEGDQPHNLVIDELGVSTGTLEAGQVVTATFTVPDEAITYYCSFHPGMAGELQPTTG